MRNARIILTALAIGAVASAAPADALRLRNGQVVNGKYAGGTAATVCLETSDGIQVFQSSDVASLTFGSMATPPPSPTGAPAPPTTSAPAVPGSTTISLPAGTTLLVRMVDGVSSKDAKGKRFTTTLETDLTAGSIVVAKAGTKVYGRVETAQQSGRYAGQSKLDIRLSELTVGSSLVPIVTGPHAQAGSKSMGKTARGAATGAAIGGIADGGDGAAKGAAIGAVASGVKRGDSVAIQPGALLEFQLQQSLSITQSK